MVTAETSGDAGDISKYTLRVDNPRGSHGIIQIQIKLKRLLFFFSLSLLYVRCDGKEVDPEFQQGPEWEDDESSTQWGAENKSKSGMFRMIREATE